MSTRDLFIGGKWISGYGKELTSSHPGTGEKVWNGSAASPSDVNRAVKAAKEAHPKWAALKIEERAAFLIAYADLVKKNREMIATFISKEVGKPLWESLTELDAMVGKVAISIEAHNERCHDKQQKHPLGKSVTYHRPHGVTGVLGPFNFPGHLPNGHIVPALLAGNTVVFKPSEFTPGVGALMAQCLEAASIPPGVFNLIQGEAEIGKHLAEHDEINALFFTGSYTTGKQLQKAFIDRPGKMLALEMGGNNPLVVSSISDVKAAVYNTILSSFLTTGQRCSCARRLIVVETENSKAFIEKLIKAAQGLKVGSYTDKPEPFMGPLISERVAVQLISHQAALQSRDGRPLVKLTHKEKGWVTAGIIDTTDVKNRGDEEFFGPFLQLIRVKSLEEAIKVANETAFGLSAGILTDKKEEFDAFFQGVKAGVVNWNAPLTGASSAAPFGGVGKSGNFHPSAYYAADYCSYPTASIISSSLSIPKKPTPGITL